MTKKRIAELKNLDISKGIIIDKYNDSEMYTDEDVSKSKTTSLKTALELRKSLATMAIGTIRIWNDERYRKTSEGWKKLATKEKKRDEIFARKKAKEYHKEMRKEYGGSWVGYAEVKNRMKIIGMLAKEGKAEVEKIDDNIKVRFLKSEEEDEG